MAHCTFELHKHTEILDINPGPHMSTCISIENGSTFKLSRVKKYDAFEFDHILDNMFTLRIYTINSSYFLSHHRIKIHFVK